MPANPVAENVFGTIGTVCWCIQLVPQAWKSWRDKSTYGLSPWLVLIWASSALPLGTYNIASNTNIPLILQPQLFGTLATICWIQCLYYDKHLSFKASVLTCVVFLALFAGLQVGFVFAVRHGMAEGNDRPLQFFGVITAILIFAGLFPQFYEIWKLKEVLGISMAFMVIDGLGGVFSTLSLVFKESLDPLLAFSYISVIVLDGLVIALKLILNPIAARRRQREAEAAENAPVTAGAEKPPQELPANEPSIPPGPYLRPNTPSGREASRTLTDLEMMPPRSLEEQEREAKEEEREAREHERTAYSAQERRSEESLRAKAHSQPVVMTWQ